MVWSVLSEVQEGRLVWTFTVPESRAFDRSKISTYRVEFTNADEDIDTDETVLAAGVA